MTVLRRLWRDKGPVVVAWLFSKFITIVRLKPGDLLVVYDLELLMHLTHSSNIHFPFHVPLINGEGAAGKEILLFKQIDFKELTAIYNIALKAHQEAECNRIQNAVSSS